MAKTLRMKVLHPGGLSATKVIAEKCELSPNTTVLDVGCGSGRSAVFLAQQFGCRIIGADIDPSSLVKAQAEAIAKGVSDQVTFRVADANDLPFEDQTFDGAVFQASLIFTDKAKALREVNRKIRDGGFLGAIELAWKKSPPEKVVARVRETLCAAAVNMETHGDWIRLFSELDFEVVYSELRDHTFNFSAMVKNEGLCDAIRIALKCVSDGSVKRKMEQIKSLFRETGEYLGYGIYILGKRRVDRSSFEYPNTRALGNPNN